MNTTTKLFLGSILALSIAEPVQAQSPKQGDYYAPGQTMPQRATSGTKQGDYYSPGQTTPQHATPGEEQRIQQGDYYKPDSK
jgi:hypothetical protein